MENSIAYHDNINISNNTLGEHFAIQRFEYSPGNDKHFHQPVHRHPFFEILFVTDGECEVEVDFKKYTLKRGHTFLFSPLQVHQPQHVSENYKSYLVRFYPFVFNNEQFFREIKVFDYNFIILQEQYYIRARMLLEELNIEFKENNILKDFALGNLLKCFLITLQRAIPDTAFEKNTENIFSKLNSLIVENKFKIKKPSDYAKELQISIRALNAIIKENTGSSSGKYIRGKTIFEAQRLLCYTDLSAKEIAFKLGFDDITYFSRVFKKSTNMSPLAYRRDYLSSNNGLKNR